MAKTEREAHQFAALEWMLVQEELNTTQQSQNPEEPIPTDGPLKSSPLSSTKTPAPNSSSLPTPPQA
jgi:hypothetical protein